VLLELELRLCRELLDAEFLSVSPAKLHRFWTRSAEEFADPELRLSIGEDMALAGLEFELARFWWWCLRGWGEVGFDRPDSWMGDSVGDRVRKKCFRLCRR